MIKQEQAETKIINQFFGSPVHVDGDFEVLNSKYVPGAQCKLSQKAFKDTFGTIDMADNHNIKLVCLIHYYSYLIFTHIKLLFYTIYNILLSTSFSFLNNTFLFHF